jgi:iron complex outermembrane receptor protein
MSSFRSLSIFLGVAGLAHAQATSSAPSSAPAAPAHSEPVALDHFVVSASPFARNQVDLAQSTTVLGGQALLLKQQPTLGDTLASEPGIGATSFGPGASRPIIRGLGGDRIRLLENGVGTLDASVASPDHAVSIEPFLVERIEVVRGPASLLYGSSAVGGVVNVITHRIETELPEARVRGGGEVRFGSGADEFARGGLLDVALHQTSDRALILHVDGFRRSTENLRIPSFAESARLRAAETAEAIAHGEPAPEFAEGRLPNSALDSEGGAVGLSFVSKSLLLGVSRSGFDSNYGVPGHEHAEGEANPVADIFEGVRIDLRQRRTDFQGEWRHANGAIRGLRLKVGQADYRHTEFEPDGTPGTVFLNRGHDARLELLHTAGGAASGAVGVQLSRSDFAAVGDEAFLPPSLTRNAAVFAFQEIVRGRFTAQFGGRLERTKITPTGAAARTETDPSGSLGVLWKIDEAHVLALSLAHTGRAANAQELFADGAHAGTQSFEIGDANLGAEKSLGLELSLRRRQGFVTGAATVFLNRFTGYIFEQPTGQVAIEHDGAWEFQPADDDHALAHGGGLPVYRYTQRDARFWGAELETLWHLHESGTRTFDVKLAADFTRAREDGGNLPRIPAARVTVGALWAAGPWAAGAESQFVFDQTRVAANESPSDGYAVVSAHAAYAWTTGRTTWQAFVRGSNLANEEIRPHPSFVKDLAPLGRRAVSMGVRLAF